MNLYVRNLNYSLTEEELREVFAQSGEVSSVKIIKDRITGRAKGYGFVEMPNDEEGKNAIERINGTDVKGRNIEVSPARPPQDRPKKW
ncbi:MAG TPA: RNA-binding protein [Bacteroidetes bacterium]|nr:RNA-binding protein [Bacteroidota bacterium]